MLDSFADNGEPPGQLFSRESYGVGFAGIGPSPGAPEVLLRVTLEILFDQEHGGRGTLNAKA